VESNSISRRHLISAAGIVPFAAVRGSAQNSAVTVGLIGCGTRGSYLARLLVQVAWEEMMKPA